MAHSYSYLYGIKISMFRFFTVYGPWGRPDMALFKFTDAILNNKNIDIYNFGKMKRDFTYIDDLVYAIRLLVEKIPEITKKNGLVSNKKDSLSPLAPFRTVNIGNSNSIKLSAFVEAIEKEVGKKAKKTLKPLQLGDVKETFSNTKLLHKLTGFAPNTNYKTGISKFVSWYRNYYEV